jgi:hypothetical protein
MILVGPNEKPFGIQKDFLCAKSSYYRRYFKDHPMENAIEQVVYLPDATEEIFGLAQNFLYTGKLSDTATLPGYDVLIATWKLGYQLEFEGLCDAALEAMTECRRITQTIPATPLLIQVWNDTPEGSNIRKLLLTWAAEYIRSSESRSEFSKSLPQELLSELVVAMSHLNSAPVIQVHNSLSAAGSAQKNVHYLDEEEDDGQRKEKMLKHRHSDAGTTSSMDSESKSKSGRKPRARTSLPNVKHMMGHKNSLNIGPDFRPTKEDQLIFCADLLTRMLSGPGVF